MTKKPAIGKWLERIGPGDSVSKVVRLALRCRLAAVAYYLPLAADKPAEDAEYVHQLRVFTRRSVAVLELFRDLLPKRRRKSMKRLLQRIRRAAGAARDLDVMIQREQQRTDALPALTNRLRADRQTAQQPIVDIRRRLARRPRLEHRVKRLLRSIRSVPRGARGRRAVRFDGWAYQHLRPIVEKFFRADPADTSDLHALHQFRIRGKQLRYAMELLSGAFPPEFREQLYPRVEALQERLGTINDHATSVTRLRSWIDEADDKEARSHLNNLLLEETEQLQQCLAEFRRWWTPSEARELKSQFDSLLFEPTGFSEAS